MYTFFGELTLDPKYVITEHYASLFKVALRKLSFMRCTLHIVHQEWQSRDQVKEAWIDVYQWVYM